MGSHSWHRLWVSEYNKMLRLQRTLVLTVECTTVATTTDRVRLRA